MKTPEDKQFVWAITFQFHESSSTTNVCHRFITVECLIYAARIFFISISGTFLA